MAAYRPAREPKQARLAYAKHPALLRTELRYATYAS